MTDRPKLPWLSPACTTEQRVKFVPKAVVSAVVIDITHPDTADTMVQPPVDPVPVTVEIRQADVGPSRSVKLRAPPPSKGMITCEP
jgi:hypothetical protein